MIQEPMMNSSARIFNTLQRYQKLFSWSDLFIFAGLILLIFFGAQVALDAPEVIRGPEVSLSPQALPYYSLLSLGRMTAAYALSLLFTLFYGRAAAYHRRAEKVLIPLLDVLQSVPILSFLPVVLLSLTIVLPENAAKEISSIMLIFTSQAWNLTFAWYQSLSTIPKELREASSIFRLNPWFRFWRLELPFGAIPLVWNSMMSWAGGWFYLMAAEIFTVGNRDFRLLGLGAYLQEAANQGNFRAILYGVVTLVILVVALDQLLWRPLLAWSERFKIEMIENDNPPTSWFLNLLHSSRLTTTLSEKIIYPFNERLDHWALNLALPDHVSTPDEPGETTIVERVIRILLLVLLSGTLLFGLYHAIQFLLQVSLQEWGSIGIGLFFTLGRVAIALVIALIWTIPVGVLIGTSPRLSGFLQPLVQIAASVPATALFPIFLLFLLTLRGGLDISAILLMLTGTQWYLLFNIIAGASAIPQDLKYTAKLLNLRNWSRWRTLVLPALFPYLVTGLITASGGAWNASIVAERAIFRGKVLETTGIGSIIAQATATGNYPLLLAATLSMILLVVLINRLVWRQMYQLAEEKFRME
jgi:NitT/TauT family transport system permease protein